MTTQDFATAGFIDERFRYIIAQLGQLVPAPAQAEVVLYSYKKLAQVLDVTVETVSAWVNKDKRVEGRVVAETKKGGGLHARIWGLNRKRAKHDMQIGGGELGVEYLPTLG